MPKKGRPRLTQEDLRARLAAYCDRYGVVLNAEGLPPFPAGKRETRQHREWIAVYKAFHRLARRGRGQCERCSAAASEGSVFCEAHRAGGGAQAAAQGASLEDRHAVLAAQGGSCPICGQKLELADSVGHGHAGGRCRAVLHPRCSGLVGLAEAVGPESVDRLRAYLWPDRSPKPRK